MWLKPALAYSSELAYGVSDMDEFRAAVAKIRAGISRVGRPFDSVLGLLDLPRRCRTSEARSAWPRRR